MAISHLDADWVCFKLAGLGYRAQLDASNPKFYVIISGAEGRNIYILLARDNGSRSYRNITFSAPFSLNEADVSLGTINRLNRGLLVSRLSRDEEGDLSLRCWIYVTEAEMTEAIFDRHWNFWLDDLREVTALAR